ncbi:ABC transporter ATP-binding protein [Pseudaestuariivita atlantica]|uniref:Spermidine/putrescine import ATP-binding protein PotA n=1 Tax=Pseudaestuariivita atlantica TaxID=1317121 RepID=A0A0L1JM55_9RHOB|nr:ABC transporter ATP-binding protein [Pseudaestuariivita atlantica]KNG92841.1 spermidine/putrescine ABC transporter ATP-binding protein [Pseudaestuariivita atlantica]
MSQVAEIAVDVQNAVKRYGDFTALKSISLGVYHNEFFTLLGPSGCGKTTLLRMIAGFEDVTEGAIFLFGTEIDALPPNKRPVNTVFQNYALFPHMTVLENASFGLEMLGKSRAEAKARAGEMLELVQLSQFASRKPAQLSGGQQQRVALARALAPSPKVLLLDEPLSALDLKLRKAMQIELKHIQRETGITFIFVTHDQEEALTMSDRIAVMSAGELQQLGAPREIYEHPQNRFVADFIGETNLIEVTISEVADGRAKCRIGGGHVIECDAPGQASGSACLSVRPERMVLSAGNASGIAVPARVVENIFVGTDIATWLKVDGGPEISVRISNSARSTIFEPGANVFVNFEAGAARLLMD